MLDVPIISANPNHRKTDSFKSSLPPCYGSPPSIRHTCPVIGKGLIVLPKSQLPIVIVIIIKRLLQSESSVWPAYWETSGCQKCANNWVIEECICHRPLLLV